MPTFKSDKGFSKMSREVDKIRAFIKMSLNCIYESDIMTNISNFNLSSNCTCADFRDILKESEKKNEEGDDATWILTSAFIIFTMQSGFGLLEAGSVSPKNEANIMIKNAVDIIFGTLGYWICGFAFSFGEDPKYANEFSGWGIFFTDTDKPEFGYLFAKYFFQLSFATTATTIVSGAMAERTNLKAYMLFSFLNLVTYVFPAHWIWDQRGFLRKLGVVDVAGCGPVHLTGGVSAIVATLMLKPRAGIFDKDKDPPELASATNLVLGTFMLWWGWLGFNCGSTFGVSGGKWKLASRTAVVTINGSVGGGLWAIIYSYYLTKDFRGKLDIPNFTSCLLGGLVSITAICAICRPWEAIVIGFVGGMITSYGAKFLKFIKIDDPVTCIPVHGFCGLFGMVTVGLSGEREIEEGITPHYGVFKGGPLSYLGFQFLASLCIIGWASIITIIELLISDLIFGLRLTAEEEQIGEDFIEHGIKQDVDTCCGNCGSERNGSRRGASMYSRRRKKSSKVMPSYRRYRRGMINFGMLSYDATSIQQEDDLSQPESPLPDRTSLTELKVKHNSTSSRRSLINMSEKYISQNIGSLISEEILIKTRSQLNCDTTKNNKNSTRLISRKNAATFFNENNAENSRVHTSNIKVDIPQADETTM